jgi:hydrogenase expression/formation protein HypE
MAECAGEAGVQIVCGDTKVVEGDGGIYINTTGVGVVPEGIDICAAGARDGDVIIVSGNMGDHHAAILGCRMSINSDIKSDAAPLVEMCERIRNKKVHSMRDVTRGGLATVLYELAMASGYEFVLDQESIPVSPGVRDFAGLLGLDPLYMGNEGKMVAIVDPADAEAALAAIKSSRYGSDAAIIGTVRASAHPGLILKTPIGGLRSLGPLEGEGLPRIC